MLVHGGPFVQVSAHEGGVAAVATLAAHPASGRVLALALAAPQSAAMAAQ